MDYRMIKKGRPFLRGALFMKQTLLRICSG